MRQPFPFALQGTFAIPKTVLNSMNTNASRRTFLQITATLALFGTLAPATLAAPPTAAKPQPKIEQATFAAGCFWSMETIFKQLKGVQNVEPGYAGGNVSHPSYEQVETGTTGHAETINIRFDPKVISYGDLLKVLLTVRNPTTLNKQGPDEGPQYRSVIFYRTPEQKKAATDTIQQFSLSHVWKAPIVTAVLPYTNFYRAEDYHLDYYNRHPNEPYCKFVIAPEITEFHEKFRLSAKK